MNNLFQREYFKDLLAFVFLAILIEIFFYKVVFLNENFFWRDILSHSYPAKKIFSQALQSGYFPLWNPYSGIGIPYLADLSNQPLYFFNLIFLFLQGNSATNLMIVTHYVLASVFSYLFFKNLTSSRMIGILGGIIFALSGYCVSVSCNLEYLSPIAWLPALFWAYYKYLESCNKIFLILSATFLSLFIYVGDPMVFYFVLGFLFLRTLVHYTNKNNLLKDLKHIIFIFFLSLIFASAQLIPGLELLLYSVRSSGLNFNEATTWSFNPLRLIEFYLPFFYGHNIPYPAYWGVFLHKGPFNVPWAESIYPGTLTFLFGLCSVFLKLSKEKIYWFIVFIITLALAFGRYSPVYIFFYDNFPGFSSFRYPEKLILITSFAIIVLFCLLVKDILRSETLFSPKTKYFLVSFVVCCLLAININFYSWINLSSYKVSGELLPELFNNVIRFKLYYFGFIILIFIFLLYLYKKFLKPQILVALIILISFSDLFFTNSNAFLTSKKDFLSATTPLISFIKSNWNNNYIPRVYPTYNSSNSSIVALEYSSNQKYFNDNFYDILSLHWIDNLLPNRSILSNIGVFKSISSLSIKVIDQISEDYVFKEPQNFLSNFSIDYILASSLDVKEYINSASIIYRGKLNYLMKPKNTVKRAFMVYKALYYPNSDTITSYFLSHGFDVKNQILLKGNKPYEYYPVDPDNYVNITEYNCNKVILNYKSSTDGYLLLLEAYYPGWKAYIDNNEVKIIEANNVFRSIKAPAGVHNVKFIFDPLTVKLGIIITVIGYLLSFVFLLKPRG